MLIWLLFTVQPVYFWCQLNCNGDLVILSYSSFAGCEQNWWECHALREKSNKDSVRKQNCMSSHIWRRWDVCTSREDVQVADGFLRWTAADSEAFHQVVDRRWNVGTETDHTVGKAATACSGFARSPQYCQFSSAPSERVGLSIQKLLILVGCMIHHLLASSWFWPSDNLTHCQRSRTVLVISVMKWSMCAFKPAC